MTEVRNGVNAGVERPKLFGLAEQMIDSPVQLDIYDKDKWNLLGHAQRSKRFAGEHPWPKRMDSGGRERTYSTPVFTGFSADTQSLLLVRKDPWTHQHDPESWLVMERNLVTGNMVEPKVLAASVDGGRQMWLQIAPDTYDNWPPGMHPTLHARRADQLRIEGRLDAWYHLYEATYFDGRDHLQYEDIEALEAMIIIAQQLRRATGERDLIGLRTSAARLEVDQRDPEYVDSLMLAS